MNKLIGLIFTILCALSININAQQSVPLTGAGGRFKAASASSPPTIGGGGAAANGACAFVGTCTITLVGTVTTGTVVAFGGIFNAGGGTGTITDISICGTSLTIDVGPSIGPSSYGGAMGHGTVTGGTCTISVTFSVGGSIQNAGVGWVTLNNLNSATPDTSCQANYAASQNNPYDCTGGLTVSGSGFAVVGMIDNQNTTPTTPGGGSLTVDATAKNVGGTAMDIAIGHATTTCTAAQCGYAAANFGNVAIIGESFH